MRDGIILEILKDGVSVFTSDGEFIKVKKEATLCDIGDEIRFLDSDIILPGLKHKLKKISFPTFATQSMVAAALIFLFFSSGLHSYFLGTTPKTNLYDTITAMFDEETPSTDHILTSRNIASIDEHFKPKKIQPAIGDSKGNMYIKSENIDTYPSNIIVGEKKTGDYNYSTNIPGPGRFEPSVAETLVASSALGTSNVYSSNKLTHIKNDKQGASHTKDSAKNSEHFVTVVDKDDAEIETPISNTKKPNNSNNHVPDNSITSDGSDENNSKDNEVSDPLTQPEKEPTNAPSLNDQYVGSVTWDREDKDSNDNQSSSNNNNEDNNINEDNNGTITTEPPVSPPSSENDTVVPSCDQDPTKCSCEKDGYYYEIESILTFEQNEQGEIIEVYKDTPIKKYCGVSSSSNPSQSNEYTDDGLSSFSI